MLPLPALTLAQLAALLPPHLAGEPLGWLGEGTDHRVYALGQTLVLRFPKWVGGGEALRLEAALLQTLAPLLPLPLPEVLAWGSAAPLCPEGFAVARFLPGTPALGQPLARPAEVGRVLGQFLGALHGLPAAAVVLPTDHDPSGGDWQDAALADLKVAEAAGLLPDAARWRAVVQAPPPLAVPLVPIHGDFAAEHVLLDRAGQPCGVLDWADAALGDPARDWAGLIHWAKPELLRAALLVSPQTLDLLRRAAWYATCRALGDLAYGAAQGQPAYILAGHRALAGLAGSGRQDAVNPTPPSP
ncbi:phosphotransferase family protein [Deinococcus multiflagellatus]|uniref:Phosphotransferase family protein n=1 Tax=Deinococcus multiflagellatus TaxID=1656887 RepID=A0ABW1ZJ72_9DEIO|nr:phosphotransferase [Deinococcus multiflagellatus]MBZ9713084.1 phosphotransferase [Deinococcus multiflagellatus]